MKSGLDRVKTTYPYVAGKDKPYLLRLGFVLSNGQIGFKVKQAKMH